MANAKEESAPKEVRVKPDLSKYVKGVSGSGKKTMRTNDHVAESLDGFTLDDVGMQRMNLGNRIRGAIAKQDKAREKDKSVASGAKLLEVACEKPRAAAASRAKAAAKKKADAEAKAAAKAKEEKGKSKAA